MSSLIRSVFALFCASIVIASCGDKSGAAKGKQAKEENVSLSAIHSATRIKQRAAKGLTANEVLARFGNPHEIRNLGKGIKDWVYNVPPFPSDDEMIGTYVVHVILRITNGHLAEVKFGRMGMPPPGNEPEIALPRNANVKNPTAMKFFVVSGNPIASGTFMDSEQFPKLGFIAATPDFKINELENVTVGSTTYTENGKENALWNFSVQLTPVDTSSFKALTSTNISKALLIMLDDEPVAAPVIRAPIEHGSFLIQCKKLSLMEVIKEKLRNMERTE